MSRYRGSNSDNSKAGPNFPELQDMTNGNSTSRVSGLELPIGVIFSLLLQLLPLRVLAVIALITAMVLCARSQDLLLSVSVRRVHAVF